MKTVDRSLLLSASVVTLGMLVASQAAAFDDDLGLIGDEGNNSIGAALRICELPTNAAENIWDSIFCDVEVQNRLPAVVDERSRTRVCTAFFRMCRNTAATHRQCHNRTIGQEQSILNILSPDDRRETGSEARDCRRLASDLNRDERQRTGDQDNSLCTNTITVDAQQGQCINCGQLETICNTNSSFETAVDCGNLDFCFTDTDPEVFTGFVCDPGRFGFCANIGDGEFVDPELPCDTGWDGSSDSCPATTQCITGPFGLGRCDEDSGALEGDLCDFLNDCGQGECLNNIGDPDPADDAYCTLASGVPATCGPEVDPEAP